MKKILILSLLSIGLFANDTTIGTIETKYNQINQIPNREVRIEKKLDLLLSLEIQKEQKHMARDKKVDELTNNAKNIVKDNYKAAKDWWNRNNQ